MLYSMSQADSWLTVLTSSASSDAISDFLESREILEDKERLRPPKSPKDEESSKDSNIFPLVDKANIPQ